MVRIEVSGPGVPQLGQQRPRMNVRDLLRRSRERQPVDQVQAPVPAVAQGDGIHFPGQPLKYGPGLRYLAARIRIRAAQLGRSGSFSH